ncbi:Ribosomal rna-processing protein 7-like protein a [Dirofilaria immitis]|nr:Ribosomal rna-processing protein 7-like protein a [Dirofilaria immitis]
MAVLLRRMMKSSYFYSTVVALGRILAELGSGRPDEIIPQRGTAASDSITEGFYTACARLKTEDAVEQALQNCRKIPFFCLSNIDVELTQNGTAKLCDEYRKSFKTVAELQESVNSYIEKHDAEVLKRKQKAKRMANVPDEDGWITVTKSHYKPVPPAIVVKNKDDLLKLSKKKKRVVHLEELRRKFAEDKKKLAIAKAARKFRPTMLIRAPLNADNSANNLMKLSWLFEEITIIKEKHLSNKNINAKQLDANFCSTQQQQ